MEGLKTEEAGYSAIRLADKPPSASSQNGTGDGDEDEDGVVEGGDGPADAADSFVASAARECLGRSRTPAVRVQFSGRGPPQLAPA